MSDIDQELEAAISESESSAGENPSSDEQAAVASSRPRPEAAGGLVSDRPATSGAPPQRNVGLLLALLAMGGVVLAMVLSSADEAAVYSVTTDKLLAQREKYMGRSLRVEGDLVKGSLRQRAEPCEYRFSIQKGESVLPVRYAACVVPDTFRDVPDMDVQVTAEGELTERGYFEASHIMAKCPSKYEMQKREANGEAAPHGAMGEPPSAAPVVD
jgi:cytochrome c-type biogenesis protein CcmE